MRLPRYPWLFLRVLAAWLSAPVLIRLLPFRTILGLYSPRSTGARDEQRLARVAPYLDAAARLAPLGQGECLRRCLVLFHFLNRYGEPVAMRLGVAKEGSKILKAHSWLTRPNGRLWRPDPEARGFHEIAVITPGSHNDPALPDLQRMG